MLLLPALIQGDTPDEPYKFFREFAGLSEQQIAAISSGKAVGKVVESPTPDEVYVFGSVYGASPAILTPRPPKSIL